MTNLRIVEPNDAKYQLVTDKDVIDQIKQKHKEEFESVKKDMFRKRIETSIIKLAQESFAKDSRKDAGDWNHYMWLDKDCTIKDAERDLTRLLAPYMAKGEKVIFTKTDNTWVNGCVAIREKPDARCADFVVNLTLYVDSEGERCRVVPVGTKVEEKTLYKVICEG